KQARVAKHNIACLLIHCRRGVAIVGDVFVRELEALPDSTSSSGSEDYIHRRLLSPARASAAERETKLSALARLLDANKQAAAASAANATLGGVGEEKKVRVRVKDGCCVHPESKMAEFGHVYRGSASGDIYD